jgi:hypothetical protein
VSGTSPEDGGNRWLYDVTAQNVLSTTKISPYIYEIKRFILFFKSPSLVPILSQMNPVYIIPSYFSRIPIFIIILAVFFLLVFPTKSYVNTPPRSCYILFPSLRNLIYAEA